MIIKVFKQKKIIIVKAINNEDDNSMHLNLKDNFRAILPQTRIPYYTYTLEVEVLVRMDINIYMTEEEIKKT